MEETLKKFPCLHCKKGPFEPTELGHHVYQEHLIKHKRFVCNFLGCEKSFEKRKEKQEHWRKTHSNTLLLKDISLKRE